MVAEGRGLLLQKCSCCIIDSFETANIEMNMTNYIGFNSDTHTCNKLGC